MESSNKYFDCFCGVVVSIDSHPRSSGFDSWLYSQNFSEITGFGMGSTQPHEDYCKQLEIQFKKLNSRLRDSVVLTSRFPVLPSTS